MTKLRTAGDRKYFQFSPLLTPCKVPKSALHLPLAVANCSFLSNELSDACSDEPLKVLDLETFSLHCIILNIWSPILKIGPK